MRKIVMIGLSVMLALVVAPSLSAAPLLQVPSTVHIGQVDLSDYPRITLYVNVVDADGSPVEGLRRSDFDVVEEGRSANIVDFAGLGEQRPVDIIFVLDTTGSMGSYIEGVKETSISFAEALESRRRDYRLGLITFGDRVRESHTFTDQVDQFITWMEAQYPDGGGSDPENPLAALQEAAAFPFRTEAQRLVILITDAALHIYGDDPDEEVSFDDPRLTVDETLAQLMGNSVSVYAVAPDMSEYGDLVGQTGGERYPVGANFANVVDQLGAAIANQYRFTYRSPRPSADGTERQVQVWTGGQSAVASYTAPTESRPGAGAVEFYETLRTPQDISTDLAVVGTNLSLAALLALLFGLTSTIFNNTLNEHQEEIESSVLGRIFTALKRAAALLARPFGAEALRGRRVVTWIQVGLFLVVTALIGCFLEPAFLPLSWAGVGLFFSMLLSIGLVNLIYEGSQVFAARRFHLDAALKLNPAGVIVALACVFFSRLVGFVPGYLYGIPGGYALGAALDLSRRREAAIAGTGLGMTALLALLAWGLTLPTAFLQASLGATGMAGFMRGIIGGVQSLLLTIFFVGIEVVFLELFPVRPTNGSTLFQWSKVVWGISFGVVAFVALHTLFAPESAYLDSVRNHSLQLLLAVLALYSILTVALWYFFERRSRRRAALLCPSCGHENPAGTRFCVQCGAAVPEPKRSRRGLAMVIILGGIWLVIIVALALAALGVGVA